MDGFYEQSESTNKNTIIMKRTWTTFGAHLFTKPLALLRIHNQEDLFENCEHQPIHKTIEKVNGTVAIGFCLYWLMQQRARDNAGQYYRGTKGTI